METNAQKTDDAMVEVFGGLEAVESIRKQPEEQFCEFVLQRLGRVESARAAMKLRFDEINRQLDNEVKSVNYLFGANLQAAADNLLTKQGGKKKSVKLLTGTVGYRSSNEKLVIEDMQAAIKWCRVNDDQLLIKAMSKVNIEILRTLLAGGPSDMDNLVTGLNVGPLYEHYQKTCKINTETGEVIPGEIPAGCKLVPAEDNFYAKPATLKIEGNTTNESDS